MNSFKKALLLFAVAGGLVSCKDSDSGKKFTVKGTIKNNPGQFIYLEEIPVATMQRIVVDSVKIGKDGRYSLQSDPREATVYNLRLDQNTYPLAQVINDASPITVDVIFNVNNREFPESYEVKNSAVSLQLKDFMTKFNTMMQSAFENDRQVDTLKNKNSADSMILRLETQRAQIAAEARELLNKTISQSTNPALSMTILGYYQSMANNPGFKLQPVNTDEVTAIVNDVAAKFPAHNGVASIKNMLDAQAKKSTGWVGQTAPEIVLPDVNGKEVKLSDFKGKYVLVDFWASWCRPCRMDNPYVVKAYNRFKDKNFTILGVSLDQPGQKDAWLKAIRDDNLTWTHVSDLLYWNSPIVPLYAIEGIPFNVLVDPDGKIIAQGLRGEQVEAKLAEIFK